jgi:hypothetical protein
MGIRDIRERCDLLLERYADYHKTGAAQSKDSGTLLKDFDELRVFLDLRVAQLQQEADDVAEGRLGNTNGFGSSSVAQSALLNAKLRRVKKEAMDTFLELQVVVTKGKRITKATIQERLEELKNLYARILSIPDEVRGRKKIFNDTAYAKSHHNPGEDSKDVTISGIRGFSSNLTTREAIAFRDSWAKAKRKQNEKLDVIALGLDKLQDLGYSMGEELDRQDGFLQGVEDRVDTVDQDLNNQTKQIDGTASDVSSISRFCCISCLVFIVLALSGFLISFI